MSPGWGPDRPRYTTQSPASVAALNSIVNNPVYGDERNFTRCKHASDSASNYTDSLAVDSGSEITVYVYLDSATSPSLISRFPQDTTMTLTLPREPADDPGLSVTFTATDPEPGEQFSVWDGCRLLADSRVKLSYLPGSAEVHTGEKDGIPVSDSVISGREKIPSATVGGKPGSFDANGIYGYFLFTVLAVPI